MEKNSSALRHSADKPEIKLGRGSLRVTRSKIWTHQTKIRQVQQLLGELLCQGLPANISVILYIATTISSSINVSHFWRNLSRVLLALILITESIVNQRTLVWKRRQTSNEYSIILLWLQSWCWTFNLYTVN